MAIESSIMKAAPVFLRRVGLQNYMSIARCSVELHPLNFLVGANGAGKSNFLDSLRFTSDCLNTSVEHALRDRGGIAEVRRRSAGHPTHFGVRLEWCLPSGIHGIYGFRIGAKSKGAFEVQAEFCKIHSADLTATPASYRVESGQIVECSLQIPPAAAVDRLFLVAMSGQPEFRELYEALLRMGFYNFNPDTIRELQSADPGEVLASDGRNLASVVKRMADEASPDRLGRVVALLGVVVPGIKSVEHKQVGKKETIEFRQFVAGSKDAWRFDAENMSDGTLRALGMLVALFQSESSDGRAVRLIGLEEPETALHPGSSKVLRSALFEASFERQIIVTSHSPDLLDDREIPGEFLISVANRDGDSLIGPIDDASRTSLRDRLFTAGELLRVNQLSLNDSVYQSGGSTQPDLFDPS